MEGQKREKPTTSPSPNGEGTPPSWKEETFFVLHPYMIIKTLRNKVSHHNFSFFILHFSFFILKDYLCPCNKGCLAEGQG
jgi:hypothetical protein